ncbi:Uncharacterised protein [Mycobacteroides abscessus subsp. abscessus]|nr:Uncharacterised protein [Mycobacteroides abscessus subsp. abscessus]
MGSQMILNLHAKLGLLKLFLKHIFQVNNKLYLQLHRQIQLQSPFQIDSMIRFLNLNGVMYVE